MTVRWRDFAATNDYSPAWLSRYLNGEPQGQVHMAAQQPTEWEQGYDKAIDEAIRLVDAMRGPGLSNFASPILLRIRAELIAMRETRGEPLPAAA